MNHTCQIATCTQPATHDVMGNPDDGFSLVGPIHMMPVYCESHAADVALAFTAVYGEDARFDALDRIAARPEQEPEESPIRANRPPAAFYDEDTAWALAFEALEATR